VIAFKYAALQDMTVTNARLIGVLVGLIIIFTVYFLIRGDLMTVLLVTLSGPVLFYGNILLAGKFNYPTNILRLIKQLALSSHLLFLFHLPFLSLYPRFNLSKPVFLLLYLVGLISLIFIWNAVLKVKKNYHAS